MSSSENGKTILLSGGGTGGHVFPALAVGEELAARGWTVNWVGREEGMERNLVRSRGLPFHSLPARALVGRGPLAKVAALATLAGAAVSARRLVERLDAKLVLGTGGYVSAPAVLGARLARRPVLLLEPNAQAGVANRWLSRCAQGAAVAYQGSLEHFHCPVHVTGVPVRRQFLLGGDEAAPHPPLRLMIMGGSQGALQLNQLLPPALEAIAEDTPRLSVVHQVGEAHVESTRAAYAARRLGRVEVSVVPFLDDVAGEMKRAHLLISRAGAVTLAEICAAGRAAILIPLESAGAHQTENARALGMSGGAEVLVGDAATPERLSEILARLLADPERLNAMGQALRRLSRPDSSRKIADLVERMAEAA